MEGTSHTVAELVAYVLFDADPRVLEAQRPLHSFLVSLALFEAEAPMDYGELHAAAKALMPLEGVTKEEIDAAVELNLEVGFVCRDGEERMLLSEMRRKHLEDARERVADKRRAFHDHMLAAVRAKGVELPERERERLYEVLENRLVDLLQKRSTTVAAAWANGGLGFDIGMPDLNAREHLREVANELAPGGAGPNKLRRTAIAIGLDAGLRALPSEAAAYLVALYHRTVALALLSQDPAVRRVKSQLAERRIAYLDTNVIIAAMFAADGEHELATQVIKLTRALGAELRVTRFTVDELSRRIGDSARWIKRYHGRDELHSVVNDVIVRSFHQATHDSPALQWAAFVGGFDPPDAWLAEHEIAIDEEGCAGTEADSRVEQARSTLARIRPQVPDRILRPDALNIVHIARQRGGLSADEMGNRVWLVTLDHSLASAERALVESGTLPAGVSRMANNWVELLSPCLPPDEQQLAGYVTHLVKSQLSLLSDDPIFVKREFLLTLTESRFGIADVLEASPERARQILIRLQEDVELKALMHDPKPQDDTWNDKLREVFERAMEELERSSRHSAELDAYRLARVQAEQRTKEERQRHRATIRELAGVRGEVEDLREKHEQISRQHLELSERIKDGRLRSLWRTVVRNRRQ